MQGEPGPRQVAPAAAGPARAAPTPAWQASLDALLEPRPSASSGRGPHTPLAIELTLTPGARTAAARWQQGSDLLPKLTGRLVQPGKNGGWVAGSLGWLRLDSLSYYGNYSAAQVQVLQEIYALYRAGNSQYGFYGTDKTIDVGAFESQQLWPLLDAAAAAGVRSVRPRKLGVPGQ